MTSYIHKCNVCKKIQIEEYSPNDIDFDNKKIHCESCDADTYRIIADVNVFFKGNAWANKQIKLDKEFMTQQQLMNEPLTPTERNELKEIAAEEELRLDMKPGSILGNRYAIHHKAKVETIAKKQLDRNRCMNNKALADMSDKAQESFNKQEKKKILKDRSLDQKRLKSGGIES